MPELAYLNGKFMHIQEAMVPIEDRGLQFGDSLYEVVRLYGGRPFRLKQHLARMRRGAEVIGLDIERAGNLEEILAELARRSHVETAFIYLQVTRGVSPRNHVIPSDLQPTVIATVRGITPLHERTYERGGIAFTAPDLRWARRDVKATTLLPNIMSRTQAMNRGGYDAIHYEEDETVTEGSVSSLFCVIDGVIRTHPADHHVLPGITRAAVLECAENLNLAYREEAFTLDDMFGASDVFFADTYSEILPLREVDGKSIGEGRPGPIAQKLHSAFRELVQEETGWSYS
ncbi:MAG: aminotransferase class IV [Bacillota bacterium]